jgi:O-antigen/teichoic acid export membrane protein
MERQSFFKHAAVYGLATLLVQAGGFVLLPLYIRCLSPADFGVLEVVGRLAETVGTCLLFGGFRQALMTFYQQADGPTQRRRIVCTTLALYGGTALLGGGLALLFSPALCAVLAPYVAGETPTLSSNLLRLALAGILLEPFSLIPLTLLQARVESACYVVVVLAQFVVRVTLCIVLVRFLGWGVAGALTATLAMGVAFGVGLSVRELARGVAWPGLAEARALLHFALPLLPGGLCFFVLHHGDRFFLLRHCPADEVGTYALGYKLAMTVSVFSLQPLFMVWSARMYAVARTPEAPVAFGRAFTRILAAYVFAGLGLCLFAEEIVAVLGGAPYASAARIVAPVLLGCLFQGAVSLMDAGLYVRRRTGLKLAITLAATLVMLLLYEAFIPAWGGLGAALATLLGFALLAVITWFVGQRVFPVRYEWPRLAGLLAVAVGLWLAGHGLPAGPWGLAGKAGLWLAAPLLAWASGLVNAEEKRHLAQLARLALARFRSRQRSAVSAQLRPVTGSIPADRCPLTADC